MDWNAIYRNYDDEALAALGSAGLLRRAVKDVESGKVAWANASAMDGTVQADGQLVTLSPAGPASACCNCTAPGMCKHILAAAVWLRSAMPGEPEPVDVLAEVLAMDQESLFQQAGRAAVRKAAALMPETEACVIEMRGGALIVSIPQLDAVCRYIGNAGYSGMVSEVPAPSRAALHLLALAVVWKTHGRPCNWPDFTLAHGDQAGGNGALSDAERKFIGRVRATVLEMCGIGWSHLDTVMPTQLRALGTSARIESFPYLASLLHSLAGTAQLLSERDFGADERQAVRLAARVHALCAALELGGSETLDALRGTLQRTFGATETLELLPLGAHWWENRNGARGLTTLFWDLQANCLRPAVLARRDATDITFERELAWKTHMLWPGAGTASTLGDGTLLLEGARISADNRIATGGTVKARRLAALLADDARWRQAGTADWNTLSATLRSSAGLCATPLDYVLLKATAVAAPTIDETRQALCWTIYDVAQNSLILRLPYCDAAKKRIEHLQLWHASGMALRGIVARVDRSIHGGIVEPVTLLVERQGQLTAISPDFMPPPAATGFTALAARMTRLFRPGLPPLQAANPDPATDCLESLLTAVENKGMTGRMHIVHDIQDKLLACREFVQAAGLDTIGHAIDTWLATPAPQHALALAYLCQTCMDLDTGFLRR